MPEKITCEVEERGTLQGGTEEGLKQDGFLLTWSYIEEFERASIALRIQTVGLDLGFLRALTL